jgi:alpha-glucosidase
LENDKWTNVITPTHDVTLPFTRMVAGPMDYTPGAMHNAAKGSFAALFSEPMSQGTRAHQAAMYVVYDAPLQMLSDNPSNYRKDSVFTRFISHIPTTWEKTVALAAKSGEYVAVAKKNGPNWYIGCMTNWDGRTLDLSLSFLDGKKYRMEIVQDGINAHRHGSDYQLANQEVSPSDVLKVQMSAGGGWVAILIPMD